MQISWDGLLTSGATMGVTCGPCWPGSVLYWEKVFPDTLLTQMSVETGWGYEDGAALSVGMVVASVADPYELIVPNPKVAVLLDNGIASSGEVMAISFIGRANTRSFGSPTCGLSTSNSMFTLDGGHTLFLTTGYLADRNKNKYGIPVVPDQSSTNGSVVQDAIDWIQN